MTTKIKDLAAKTGEYQDANTGEMKANWQNVGAIMKKDDGSTFVILDRTFNPAGVPNPDNRSNVILGAFDVRVKGEV